MPFTEQQIMADTSDWLVREFLFMRPDARIGADDDLIDSGVIDSMGVLELMLFLEEAFGVEVGDHQVRRENIGTLRNIARFVLRHLQAAV